jgi:hypothetical protein
MVLGIAGACSAKLAQARRTRWPLYQGNSQGHWYIDYWISGRRCRESSHSADRAVAEQLLKARIRERNLRRGQPQKQIAAQRIFERFTKLTLIDLLTQSVQALALEMRRLNQPIPGIYFDRSSDFIKIGYMKTLDRRLPELGCT